MAIINGRTSDALIWTAPLYYTCTDYIEFPSTEYKTKCSSKRSVKVYNNNTSEFVVTGLDL